MVLKGKKGCDVQRWARCAEYSGAQRGSNRVGFGFRMGSNGVRFEGRAERWGCDVDWVCLFRGAGEGGEVSGWQP